MLGENRFYSFLEKREASSDAQYEFDGSCARALSSPSVIHQQICSLALSECRQYFSGKKCLPIVGVDLFLFSNARGDDKNVTYIPDLMVVCKKEYVTKRGVIGTPSLVMEVWSPANMKEERFKKRQHYKEAGVDEIWEIDPETSVVFRLCRDEEWNYEIVRGDLHSPMESKKFKGLTFHWRDEFSWL